MVLDALWNALESGKWKNLPALKEATGINTDAITDAINFLSRWNFIDTEHSPELLVRRKSDSISPVETINLLRDITSDPTEDHKFAERVACRVCNSRDLSFSGENEVECEQCHEKQWFTLDASKSQFEIDPKNDPQTDPNFVTRMLLRLGRPQKAFQTNIPGPTQYFWFRCTSCGTTSTDYAHGHSRYLTCPQCQTHNHF
jgi:hypothetical protein